MRFKRAGIAVVLGAAASATMIAGPAHAATQPASATATTTAAVQPAFWGVWEREGPYAEFQACDTQEASWAAKPDLRVTSCEPYGSGYAFYYDVWY